MKGGPICPRAISMMSLATEEAVGREPAPGPDEHDLAHEIALDGNAVQHAIDAGQRARLRDHGRRNARLDAAGRFGRHGQEFDAVAKLVRGAEVGGRNAADAFQMDGVEIWAARRRRARRAASAYGRHPDRPHRRSGRPPHNPAPAPRPAPRQTARPSRCMRVRM